MIFQPGFSSGPWGVGACPGSSGHRVGHTPDRMPSPAGCAKVCVWALTHSHRQAEQTCPLTSGHTFRVWEDTRVRRENARGCGDSRQPH